MTRLILPLLTLAGGLFICEMLTYLRDIAGLG